MQVHRVTRTFRMLGPILGALTLTLVLAGLSRSAVAADSSDDPYVWLEEVEGEKAMAWVTSQNSISVAAL